ncbi:thrombomodulin-like [Mantella aurantiaca]
MQFLSRYQLGLLHFPCFPPPHSCQHATHLHTATTMLLLYSALALVNLELALLASLDERQREFVCIDQACYSVSWSSRKYERARRECEENMQHLMTIKNSEQAKAISLLISELKMENIKVWIGLEPIKGCTDLNLTLRGFTWVTGDSYTDSILWNKDEQKCASPGGLCVTVNSNGTWEETDCTFKSNGLLCESSHSVSCGPLMLPDDYSATYSHPFHGMGRSVSDFYPSDTSVLISPIQENLFCEDKGDGQLKWDRKTPGAWPCEIANGGCEHECMVVTGTPQCICPSGSKLKPDKRSCSSPCDPNLCSQVCDPTSKPPSSPCSCLQGYLAEDGKTCLDDDCAIHPDMCRYQCTNSNGSVTCDCKPGFKKDNDECESHGECGVKCQDIDECGQTMCEHKCNNVLGSYKCVCNEGYVIDENNPNKCKWICNPPNCKPECNEKSCSCPEGYIMDGNEDTCIDVDECLENPCDRSCNNLFGSYECTFPEDYTVHSAEYVPYGTEGPGGVTTEAMLPSGSFPQITFSLEPTLLLGICIGVLCMLTVLIAMVCFILRKHYMDQHDFDYKIKNTEKYVVLQQVKTIPQWKL